MKKYQVLTRGQFSQFDAGNILFEGKFKDFKTCLEQAVKDNVDLSKAHLARRNLSNTMLDGAMLKGADFTGANLCGSNLSESQLDGAVFISADLVNACLACASMRGCLFGDASFGATIITGADISYATFSTLSCFTLDFMHTRAMEGCIFSDPEGLHLSMSRPPVVIKGLSAEAIIFMDRHIKIDSRVFNTKDGISFLTKPKILNS
ncbi:MAG: pentapeptide repeat-containing protein [Alphaproteobacteria bacterium]|nr:pentapeptide repeat-containing protein [Alphaproteobacteria bacterium]